MKLATLFVLFLLTWQSSWASECTNHDCLSIGSFNIRLFGNNGPADTQAEIDRLVAQIHDQADMDVVVLQEINIGSSEWLTLLLPALNEAGYALSGTGSYGGSSPDRQQFVVMLHKTETIEQIDEVTDLSNETLYDDGAGCVYDSVRSPTTAKFRARHLDLNFRLYGVHLKSNRPVGDDEQCDNQIRTTQIEQITDSIQSFSANQSGTHFIIAGDFNTEFENPEMAPLRQVGYQTAIQAECTAELLENCTFIIERFAGAIDHIVYSPSLAEQFEIVGAIGSFGDNKNYLDTQSDHVPVWVEFSVND